MPAKLFKEFSLSSIIYGNLSNKNNLLVINIAACQKRNSAFDDCRALFKYPALNVGSYIRQKETYLAFMCVVLCAHNGIFV
jgi:hypothetical protein